MCRVESWLLFYVYEYENHSLRFMLQQICNCCRTKVLKMSQQALEALKQLLSKGPLVTCEKGMDLLLFVHE